MSKIKLMLAATAVAMSMVAAEAAINVTVSGAAGFYLEDDTTGLLETSPNGWVQFILITSGSPTVAGPGGTVGANESVIAEFGLTNGGNSDNYGAFLYDLDGTYEPGGWYVRVFEGGSSTTGVAADNIVLGTWYYESAVFPTIDNIVPETPDAQEVGGNNPTVLQSAFGGDFVNRQVVPEPATIAFLGIGGLVLAIRRRLVA